tara:strand:+ start:595 stop:1788 length:1194 start_codon:yes stop_codon:yes gene_type:complete
MSKINVRSFSNENEDGAPDLVGISTFSATSFFVPTRGTTAQRPTDHVEVGSLRYNYDIKNLEYFRGKTMGWSQFELVTPNLGGGTGSNTGLGTRGVKGGGANPGTNVIEFITISTLGNSQDFGDLTVSAKAQSGAASRTRGLFAAGDSPNTNRIDFITIASAGIDAADFGDIASSSQRHANGMANQTRALFAGGYGGSPVPGHTNTIDMVTIAVKSDTKDFGDLSYSMTNAGSCASSTRGVVAGGQNPGYVNTIDHITIASLGSAVDSGGDLTVARRTLGAASNSVKGIFFGGQYSPSNNDNALTNVIDQLIIASNGDATDFGDLTFSVNNGRINAMSGLPSATRVAMPGGYTFDSGDVNTIEYVEIATTGNSIDFGTLATRGTAGPSGFSNGHGGL